MTDAVVIAGPPRGGLAPVLPAPHDATMLIGSDRIFFTGRLRRSMKARRLGAVSIYAVPEGQFEIAVGDNPRQSCRIVAVPAHLPHRILPPRGPIWNLLLEPESLTDKAIDAVVGSCNGAGGESMLAQLRRAESRLTSGGRAMGFTTSAFDDLFFGTPLPARAMDDRIVEILRLLREEPNEARLSAETCAAAVGLSASRLLHLFRQETGIAFRSCRMWKRARRFLDQANGEASLTDVALGLGYPDSSHFSHSIRRTFGMQPGAIRAGARGMLICPGANYTLFAAC